MSKHMIAKQPRPLYIVAERSITLHHRVQSDVNLIQCVLDI